MMASNATDDHARRIKSWAGFFTSRPRSRKLNKKMSEYRFNKRTYQQDLNKIYHEILDEKEDMQNDYDKETNHSINIEKQAKWLKKIEEMLEEYVTYADY